EIADQDKPAFLSAAVALLAPINWDEPFGLVMIEAMACGTPVVAFNRGAVAEVVESGVTGFIVEDEAAAAKAVDAAAKLCRKAIRDRFEQRFTARRMADEYVSVYRELIEADEPLPSLVARLKRAGDGFGLLRPAELA